MKVSLITVSFNSVKTIEQTINSVLSQNYENIEYIVIDGSSCDGTQEILKKYEEKLDILIIEKDKGIYDAMNKGIRLSSGEIIGIINSDDFYHDNNVINEVVEKVKKNPECDVFLSDIFFINKKNMISRRIYAKYFKPWKLRFGWMPPHPGIFLKKNIINEIGLYDISYMIASDFEYCLRLFFRKSVKFYYLNLYSVVMREGGLSTKGFRSDYIISKEMIRSLKTNKIYSNTFFVYSRLPIKFMLKIFYLIQRRKN